MASYDWREHPETIASRFPDWVRGVNSWRRFTRELQEFARRLMDEADSEAVRRMSDAYRRFLDDAAAEAAGPPDCRVFVSHQRADVRYGERIAWLAVQEGFEYWLDVHDPQLRAADRSTLSGPPKAFAIAAIIEIALLNSSHVVGVQTTNSRKSRWVPYEFGRGKRPVLASTQAASWFEPGTDLDPDGDYLALGRRAYRELEVRTWLRDEMTHRACHATTGVWPGSEPHRLPEP